MWYERLDPLTPDHSAHASTCFGDEEMAALMDDKVPKMVRVDAVILSRDGSIPDVLTRLHLAPKLGKND